MILTRIAPRDLKKAHDGILWVMVPGLEIDHPGSAGLDDLQLLEVFVPVSVGSPYDILGLLVGRLDVPQRDFFFAVGEDAIKMFLDHGGKAFERLHPAPFEGIDPFPEELHCPCPGPVLPKMAEGLLEEVRLHEPGAHQEECLQGLSGRTRQIGPVGQENELLAGQQPSQGLPQAFELLLSHFVDGVQEMPDHVEFVVDDLGLGTMGQKALPKGLPHVHHAMRDQTGPVFSEPPPERLQTLLLASLHDIQELRAPRALQGADHRPVGLHLADADLVEPQDGDSVQRPLRLNLLHHRLVDLPDRSPMQPQEDPDRLVRHDFAQFVDQTGQGLCRMRAANVQEVQGFRPDPAVRTGNPKALEADNGQGLPPHQMPDFLNMAVVSGKTCFSARAASMESFGSLEGNDHHAMGRFVFNLDVHHSKLWKIQKCRDNVIGHPVSPPCSHLAMDTRKNFISPGAFLHHLVKSRNRQSSFRLSVIFPFFSGS